MRTDARKHTKHCCVSILTWPLVAGSLIPKRQSFSLTQHVYWIDPHRKLNRCCTRAAFWCLHSFLKHFPPRNQRAADLILSCPRAFLIPSNCVGCLGNPFKSFLYWDRTLQQGSYSHYLQMHTHAGRVNLGQANMKSWTGDRLLKNYPTTPTHELSKYTGKKIPHSTLSPSLTEPQSAVDWETKGVIRLSLYKHGARKKETGRRNGTDQVRNSSKRLQNDKEI